MELFKALGGNKYLNRFHRIQRLLLLLTSLRWMEERQGKQIALPDCDPPAAQVLHKWMVLAIWPVRNMLCEVHSDHE